MKKGTKNRKELKNGMMTENTINANSTEYREAQAEMFNLIQGQTKEEKFNIEMTALQIRMKKYLESEIKRESELKHVHWFYKEMLKITHVKQSKLAEYINVRANNLGDMFKEGKVNYRTAKIIEAIFKIQFSLWLDIQSKNEYISNPKKDKKHVEEYSFHEMLTA